MKATAHSPKAGSHHHQDLSSSPFSHALTLSSTLAHQHWPSPHTLGPTATSGVYHHHALPTMLCCLHHAMLHPPCRDLPAMSHSIHHTTQPRTPWQPLQQIRTTASAGRMKHGPSSASVANFSFPSLHTSRHLSEKQSPLKPKPTQGRRKPFHPCCPDTPASSAISGLLPPQPPDKRGFPLDLLFKNHPKTSIQQIQINELEPSAGGQCPCLPHSAGCSHHSAATAFMSYQYFYLLVALSYFLS